MDNKIKKPQPTKVKDYRCSRCGDLLLRNYPYSPYNIPPTSVPCRKCAYEIATQIRKPF